MSKMKAYVCDCCNAVISDPYEAQMKEFYYGAEYNFGTAFPIQIKNRRKIHFCGTCFDNLKNVAKKKDGADMRGLTNESGS